MKYKTDFDIIKKRYRAFWNNDIYDRCVAQITCKWSKKSNLETNHPNYLDSGESLEKHWKDPQGFVDRYLDFFVNSALLGDALPCAFVDQGPGTVAAYLGSGHEYKEDTVWFSKIDDIENYPLAFDPDNDFWVLSKKLLSYVYGHSKGKFLTIAPDLGGVMDIQAFLMGTEEFLIDVVTKPEAVRSHEASIMSVWKECFCEFNKIIECDKNGMVTWLKLWSPSTSYVIQADLSCNISSGLFEELFLPFINWQCDFVEYPIYHLDGKGAIRHLDDLLKIKKLRAVQWQPGFGGGKSIEQYEMLQKIQQAGKSVVIEIEPADIELVKKYLSPKGLCLQIECVSEEEGLKALDKINKWK